MRDSPTVTIRGQHSDDWEYLYLLLNEPDVLRNTIELLPYQPEDGVRDRAGGAGANTQMLVAEVGQPSGRKRLIGAAWLIHYTRPRRQHCARLTVTVHPDYRGAQRALMDAVLDLADNWLGLRRIEVTIFQEDEPALAFFRQHGFDQEAILRQYAFRAGSCRDALLLARLRRPATAENHSTEAPAQLPARDAKASRLAITIRGIEVDDWEDLAAIRTSSNVVYNTLQLPYLSRDTVREHLENMPENQRGIVAVVEDQVVGNLGLHLESGRRAHIAGLGMMVHPDFQGRGVGAALMEAAIDLAENWLAISRIELTCFVDNAAGVALYRRFGFEIEGILRDYVFREGRYVDAYIMARIRDEA